MKIFCNKLRHLEQIVDISSYSYMVEYLNLLIELTWWILYQNDLSKQDLLYFHKGISSSVEYINILSLQDKDENQYQKNVLLGINSFIEFKGKVRDLTLDFLKNNYPLYYDSAQNGLKIIEKFEQIKKDLEQTEKKLEQSYKKLEALDKVEKEILKRIMKQEIEKIWKARKRSY